MKNWRPPNWKEIRDKLVFGVTGSYFGSVKPDSHFSQGIEAGADAMHKADIEWLEKYSIAKYKPHIEIEITKDAWLEFQGK